MRTQMFLFLFVAMFASSAQAGLGIVKVVTMDSWSEVSAAEITINATKAGEITITDGRQVTTIKNGSFGCEYYRLPNFNESFERLSTLVCRTAGLVDLKLIASYEIDGYNFVVEENLVGKNNIWKLSASKVILEKKSPMELIGTNLQGVEFIFDGNLMVVRLGHENLGFVLDMNCRKNGPYCSTVTYTFPSVNGVEVVISEHGTDGYGAQYFAATARNKSFSGVINEELCRGGTYIPGKEQRFKFCDNASVIRMVNRP